MRPTCLYRYFNAADELLYVGISLSAVIRLSQHVAGQQWADQIARIMVEHHPTREEARAAERAAIGKERPKYNKMFAAPQGRAWQVSDVPPLDIHPGCYLRDTILPEFGMTNVSDLARRLGVNRPNLVNVLAGRSDVSRDLAYRLGALLNDHVADLLIAYQHAWDLEQERDRREGFKGQIERIEAVEA